MHADRQAEETASANYSRAATSTTPDLGLLSALKEIIFALKSSAVRKSLVVLAVAVVLVIAASTYGQVKLVHWNKPFFAALFRRDLRDYLFQLGVFFVLAGMLAALNVAQGSLRERLKVKMREALSRDLISHWLRPGRASALAHAEPIGAIPVQHVLEEVRHLAELSVELAVGLLGALTMSSAFMGLLWVFSGDFIIPLAGGDIVIRRYLVWTALVYAIFASLLSLWAGRRLISRNAKLSASEANLNHSLVRVNNHIDAISFAAGEGNEARQLEGALSSVLTAMRHVVYSLSNLTWVTSVHVWLTRAFPTVALSPLLFSGQIGLGDFFVASLAFIQVQTSLHWFVENFTSIVKWRATLGRVASFRRTMILMESTHDIGSRITMIDGAAGRIIVENLLISTASGTTELIEKRVEITAGEHVLIVDESAARDALLFRVLAGLWPWGAGKIERSWSEPIMHVPRTAYFPPSTLREVLAYPSTIQQFEGAALSAGALARLGLERLIPMLDTTRRWDRVLNEEERHCVVFTRVVLRRPNWLIVDQVFDLLDQSVLERILAVFAAELPNMGMIYIGGESSLRLFSRVLHARTAASEVSASI